MNALNPVKAPAIFALTLFVIATTAISTAWGAGKKKPNGPIFTTPQPFRRVVVRPVGTLPFQLPNGVSVDLKADLTTMVGTALTTDTNFLPASEDLTSECEPTLEIRAAVSTLDLNVAQIGASFGYTPAGATSTVTNATGKLDVKIGTVAMDFGIWQCVRGKCSELVASTSSHATAEVNLTFQIDFDSATTSPSLVYNTPLGATLRKIMDKGLKELNASNRVSKLSWFAQVKEVQPSTGSIIFDSGAQGGVKVGNAFEIYAASESGYCNIYKAVAQVNTTQVGAIASQAEIVQTWDSRGVLAGDWVFVHEVE